ncbi:alpha/beta fold hydrolase [Chryseobacterium populi]|uniref:Putative hydrolase or acyltransferase of alpha/beta superfamily n=1 Tax=Chryseobacterium populi TaxID=1144316 RepID=J3CE21_9FLAO|nr:alpha/beta hydrolase [Chryseobacterium populi]EJL69571.1 putative hydrolase or acyltransferase of alpha/beta superfamily [Chryseobacterium populi]
MTAISSTAITQFAELSSNKIAFRSFGTGTPLLFANRFRGVLDTWDPLFLDQLAKENQVVLFDYPGIGHSEGSYPTDMKELSSVAIQLADHLKIDKFNILGWSLGGLIAQYVMFYYPERVLKTVILGSNPPGENKVPFDPEFFKRALKPVNDLEDEIVLFFEPQSEKSRVAATASHNRITKRLDVSKIPATQELMQKMLASAQGVKEDKENFRGAYQMLKQPVLAIQGDHDISFAVENWFPLLRDAPTLQLIILPESGHGPHHQYPVLVSNYINNFLKFET